MYRALFTFMTLWIAGSVQADSPELIQLDRLMAQQLNVERATTALQLEAQQSQADGERLLALYRQEHKALTHALSQQQQQQGEVAEQREELLKVQQLQEQRSEQYQQQLVQGQQLIETLWPQLPPPLQIGLKASSQQLADQQLGLSERYAALIKLLSRLEEFNSSISQHQGSLTHEGQTWRVEQLYVGLAQGYYRLPDGSGVGIGYVSDGIWQWHSAVQFQAEINQAFAIYQGQAAVEFITLPLSAVAEVQL